MKNFLVIYTCAENSKSHQAWKQLAPEVQEARMESGLAARAAWFTKYKDQIIYEGASLSAQTKKIDPRGIVDLPSQMGALFVVQAESHQKAAEMFLDHPHFTFFPGDGIEVLECLPKDALQR